jgi:hypothetical protein
MLVEDPVSVSLANSFREPIWHRTIVRPKDVMNKFPEVSDSVVEHLCVSDAHFEMRMGV